MMWSPVSSSLILMGTCIIASVTVGPPRALRIRDDLFRQAGQWNLR